MSNEILNQVCFTNVPDLVATIGAGLVTIATSSFIANFVKPDTLAGKIVHWLALNFKVQKAE